MGKSFLIVVDAHKTTTTSTISILRFLFSHYGLPLQLVTDNGPQFVSEEFHQFMQMNGIRHIRSAPYHPASNGQADLQTGHEGHGTSSTSVGTSNQQFSIKVPHHTTLNNQQNTQCFVLATRNSYVYGSTQTMH